MGGGGVSVWLYPPEMCGSAAPGEFDLVLALGETRSPILGDGVGTS